MPDDIPKLAGDAPRSSNVPAVVLFIVPVPVTFPAQVIVPLAVPLKVPFINRSPVWVHVPVPRVNVAPEAIVVEPVTLMIGFCVDAVAPALVPLPMVKSFVTMRV